MEVHQKTGLISFNLDHCHVIERFGAYIEGSYEGIPEASEILLCHPLQVDLMLPASCADLDYGSVPYLNMGVKVFVGA